MCLLIRPMCISSEPQSLHHILLPLAMLQSLFLVSLLGAARSTSLVSRENDTFQYFESLPSLSSGADCACTKLSAKFGDLLLSINSSDYTTQAEDFYDIRAVLQPGCIFMPTHADQVASGMSIIASCGAQFAIRAGGHMNVSCSRSVSASEILTEFDYNAGSGFKRH